MGRENDVDARKVVRGELDSEGDSTKMQRLVRSRRTPCTRGMTNRLCPKPGMYTRSGERMAARRKRERLSVSESIEGDALSHRESLIYDLDSAVTLYVTVQ